MADLSQETLDEQIFNQDFETFFEVEIKTEVEVAAELPNVEMQQQQQLLESECEEKDVAEPSPGDMEPSTGNAERPSGGVWRKPILIQSIPTIPHTSEIKTEEMNLDKEEATTEALLAWQQQSTPSRDPLAQDDCQPALTSQRSSHGFSIAVIDAPRLHLGAPKPRSAPPPCAAVSPEPGDVEGINIGSLMQVKFDGKGGKLLWEELNAASSNTAVAAAKQSENCSRKTEINPENRVASCSSSLSSKSGDTTRGKLKELFSLGMEPMKPKEVMKLSGFLGTVFPKVPIHRKVSSSQEIQQPISGSLLKSSNQKIENTDDNLVSIKCNNFVIRILPDVKDKINGETSKVSSSKKSLNQKLQAPLSTTATQNNELSNSKAPQAPKLIGTGGSLEQSQSKNTLVEVSISKRQLSLMEEALRSIKEKEKKVAVPVVDVKEKEKIVPLPIVDVKEKIEALPVEDISDGELRGSSPESNLEDMLEEGEIPDNDKLPKSYRQTNSLSEKKSKNTTTKLDKKVFKLARKRSREKSKEWSKVRSSRPRRRSSKSSHYSDSSCSSRSTSSVDRKVEPLRHRRSSDSNVKQNVRHSRHSHRSSSKSSVEREVRRKRKFSGSSSNSSTERKVKHTKKSYRSSSNSSVKRLLRRQRKSRRYNSDTSKEKEGRSESPLTKSREKNNERKVGRSRLYSQSSNLSEDREECLPTRSRHKSEELRHPIHPWDVRYQELLKKDNFDPNASLQIVRPKWKVGNRCEQVQSDHEVQQFTSDEKLTEKQLKLKKSEEQNHERQKIALGAKLVAQLMNEGTVTFDSLLLNTVGKPSKWGDVKIGQVTSNKINQGTKPQEHKEIIGQQKPKRRRRGGKNSRNTFQNAIKNGLKGPMQINLLHDNIQPMPFQQGPPFFPENVESRTIPFEPHNHYGPIHPEYQLGPIHAGMQPMNLNQGPLQYDHNNQGPCFNGNFNGNIQPLNNTSERPVIQPLLSIQTLFEPQVPRPLMDTPIYPSCNPPRYLDERQKIPFNEFDPPFHRHPEAINHRPTQIVHSVTYNPPSTLHPPNLKSSASIKQAPSTKINKSPCKNHLSNSELQTKQENKQIKPNKNKKETQIENQTESKVCKSFITYTPAGKLKETQAANPTEPPAVNPIEPPAANPIEPPAANPIEPPAANPIEPSVQNQPPAVNPNPLLAVNLNLPPPAVVQNQLPALMKLTLLNQLSEVNLQDPLTILKQKATLKRNLKKHRARQRKRDKKIVQVPCPHCGVTKSTISITTQTIEVRVEETASNAPNISRVRTKDSETQTFTVTDNDSQEESQLKSWGSGSRRGNVELEPRGISWQDSQPWEQTPLEAGRYRDETRRTDVKKEFWKPWWDRTEFKIGGKLSPSQLLIKQKLKDANAIASTKNVGLNPKVVTAYSKTLPTHQRSEDFSKMISMYKKIQQSRQNLLKNTLQHEMSQQSRWNVPGTSSQHGTSRDTTSNSSQTMASEYRPWDVPQQTPSPPWPEPETEPLSTLTQLTGATAPLQQLSQRCLEEVLGEVPSMLRRPSAGSSPPIAVSDVRSLQQQQQQIPQGSDTLPTFNIVGPVVKGSPFVNVVDSRDDGLLYVENILGKPTPPVPIYQIPVGNLSNLTEFQDNLEKCPPFLSMSDNRSLQGTVENQTPPISVADIRSLQGTVENQTPPISVADIRSLQGTVENQTPPISVADIRSLQGTVENQIPPISIADIRSLQGTVENQIPPISITDVRSLQGTVENQIAPISVVPPPPVSNSVLTPDKLTKKGRQPTMRASLHHDVIESSSSTSPVKSRMSKKEAQRLEKLKHLDNTPPKPKKVKKIPPPVSEKEPRTLQTKMTRKQKPKGKAMAKQKESHQEKGAVSTLGQHCLEEVPRKSRSANREVSKLPGEVSPPHISEQEPPPRTVQSSSLGQHCLEEALRKSRSADREVSKLPGEVSPPHISEKEPPPRTVTSSSLGQHCLEEVQKKSRRPGPTCKNKSRHNARPTAAVSPPPTEPLPVLLTKIKTEPVEAETVEQEQPVKAGTVEQEPSESKQQLQEAEIQIKTEPVETATETDAQTVDPSVGGQLPTIQVKQEASTDEDALERARKLHASYMKLVKPCSVVLIRAEPFAHVILSGPTLQATRVSSASVLTSLKCEAEESSGDELTEPLVSLPASLLHQPGSLDPLALDPKQEQDSDESSNQSGTSSQRQSSTSQSSKWPPDRRVSADSIPSKGKGPGSSHHLNQPRSRATRKATPLSAGEASKPAGPSTSSKPASKQQGADRPRLCKVCCKKLPNSSALKRHLVNHTREQNKCLVCSKNFDDSYKLKCHMAIAHVKEKKHICLQCGKRFCELLELDIHKKSAHPVQINFGTTFVDLYKCEKCAMEFKSNDELLQHKLLLHPAVLQKFTCPVCGKDFFSDFFLAGHIKKFHGLVECKCQHCGYLADSKESLMSHIENLHMVAHPGRWSALGAL